MPVLGLVVFGFLSLGSVNAEVPAATGFGPLKEMKTAPSAIARSSRAVVRIQSRNEAFGTGFFIAPNGFLVTNAHVVGPENCTREGCYVKLDLQLDHEQTPETKEVFLVPKYTDSIQDLSIFSVFDPSEGKFPGKPFQGPEGLTFAEGTSATGGLYLAGHPFAGLKRWSVGTAVRQEGYWTHTDHFVPSGNSGSPILNDQGHISGFVHRARDAGEETLDLFAVRPSGCFSEAKLLKTIHAELNKAPHVSVKNFISIPLSGTVTRSEDSFEEDLVDQINASHLISRKLWALKIKEGKTREKLRLMDLLKEGCESEIFSGENSDNPDFPYFHCELAKSLLSCKERWQGDEATRCPDAEEQESWKTLFHELAEYTELKSQDGALDWILAASQIFETSEKTAKEAGLRAVHAYLEKKPLNPFFTLEYLAANAQSEADLSFKGVNYWDLLKGYSKEPFYSQFAENFIGALEKLSKDPFLPPEMIQTITGQILQDPAIPLSLKADLESSALGSSSESKIKQRGRLLTGKRKPTRQLGSMRAGRSAP
jgi:hypothetical protein